jgi:hypothetical protein
VSARVFTINGGMQWNRRPVDSPRAIATVLALTVTAIIGIFLLAGIYARSRMSSSAEALRIAANGAPSVRYLAAARNDVRDLRRMLALSANVDAPMLEGLQRTRKSLAAHLADERKTPSYTNEAELSHQAAMDLARLEEALGQLAEGTVSPALRMLIEQRIEALDAILDRQHELDSTLLQRDALAILANERDASRLFLELDALSIALALLAGALMLRVLNRHFELLRRRALELEYFAVQVGHDIFNPLTPIKLTLDLCHERAVDDTLRTATARSLRSVERLRHAAEALLAFAHAGRPPAESDRAGLKESIEAAVVALSPVTVAVEPFEDRLIRASASVVDGLMRVLLREAIRQSDPAPAISVVVSRREDQARIEIRIPRRREQPRASQLFAPQVRGPSSGAPGIDVELFAARRVVEAHRGRIGVQDQGEVRVLWFQLPTV